MPNTPTPKSSEIPYNFLDPLPDPEPAPSQLRVIIPLDAPQLGPDAAQALLRLLITAHQKPPSTGQPTQEAP
jgi:hypothetical protein